MFTNLLVFLAIIAVSLGAEWVIDTDTQATTAVGCGAGDSTHGIAGAAQNGEGPIVDLFDGSSWTKKRNAVQAGLLMDAAISVDGNTQYMSSMGSTFLSTDGGDSYNTVPGFIGISQDVHITPDIISAVGSFLVTDTSNDRPSGASGVAYSTDGGADWNVAQVLNEANCRYGAFPSANTWYVAAGMWNSSTTAYSSAKHVIKSTETHTLTHRVSIGSNKHKPKITGTGVSESSSGWYGNIYKTTDNGKSFTLQYQSPDDALWYFNEISCSDDNNCIAVAEGYNNDMTAPYAGVYQTTDGGASWKAVWESSDYQSIMACHMVSASEAWFAASPNQRGIATDFYHTTDGGSTWTVEQTLAGCMVLDMDMSGTLGIATCMNSSGSAMVLAHYAQ